MRNEMITLVDKLQSAHIPFEIEFQEGSAERNILMLCTQAIGIMAASVQLFATRCLMGMKMDFLKYGDSVTLKMVFRVG